MTSGLVLFNLALFAGLLILLARCGQGQWTLSRRVLMGLALGALFGLGLHITYGPGHELLTRTLEWVNLVGYGYVRLLHMIVMPLVLVSILAAVARLKSAGSLGKISILSIGTLLLTTLIAAVIGIAVAQLFGLNAEGLVAGAQELAREEQLQARMGQVATLNLPSMLTSFIPRNPFAELTGASATSIISVVIFATLLGLAALQLYREKPEQGEAVLSAIDKLQALVMQLVRLVMKLTPYGVLALITKVVASTQLSDILNLGSFVVASYIAIALMFVVHGALLALLGLNPLTFFRKIWPVLTFAFTSRSSAATIPLNVETQEKKLGVPGAIANFSASFGATIGQNGCAGLYPAMLAMMVAPAMGIDVTDPVWLLTLVGVVTISSFGVAGVGGGATFAALIVLPTMGLPVTIAALLISIEPLIDMGRTALNVSGAMTAGTVTGRLLGQLDQARYQQQDEPAVPSVSAV